MIPPRLRPGFAPNLYERVFNYTFHSARFGHEAFSCFWSSEGKRNDIVSIPETKAEINVKRAQELRAGYTRGYCPTEEVMCAIGRCDVPIGQIVEVAMIGESRYDWLARITCSPDSERSAARIRCIGGEIISASFIGNNNSRVPMTGFDVQTLAHQIKQFPFFRR